MIRVQHRVGAPLISLFAIVVMLAAESVVAVSTNARLPIDALPTAVAATVCILASGSTVR